MSKLFHLSKNNRFGLEYPSLEERWEKFKVYIKESLLETDSYLCYLRKFNKVEITKEAYKIIAVNNCISFNRLIFCREGNFKPLLKNEFLYIFDIFCRYINSVDLDKDDELTKYGLSKFLNDKKKLLNGLELFDLDYTWNEKTKQIERKIDEANTSIINNNLESLNLDSDYQACIDEFLKPRADIDFLKSLKHIYSVLEKVAGKHADKSGSLRLHEKQRMAKYITKKDKHYQTIQHVFGFINDFIHHPEKHPDHTFNEPEYIYWWLEINKLIFILNTSNHKTN